MTVDTERQKCVVLAGQDLSPRQLSEELIQRGITPVSCYDGGVEMFIHGCDGRAGAALQERPLARRHLLPGHRQPRGGQDGGALETAVDLTL